MLNNFFASIYDFFYFEPGFSGNMFAYGLYGILGLLTVIIAVTMPLLYYFALNHPRYNRKIHWAIMLLINAVFIGILTPIWISTNFYDSGITGSFFINIIEFTILNVFLATLLSSVISFLVKGFSVNCSKTPF